MLCCWRSPGGAMAKQNRQNSVSDHTGRMQSPDESTAARSHVQMKTWANIEMCAAAMQHKGKKLMDKEMAREDRKFKLEEMLNYVSVMQRQLEQDFQDDKKLEAVLPLHMKKQLMARDRMMWLALMMAVFNYVTDILFLKTELLPVPKFQTLALMLTSSLVLCLVTRVGAVVYLFCTQMMNRDKLFREEDSPATVKPGIFKRGYNKVWASLYSLMTIIEPTEGLRLLEKAFDERKKFGTDFRGKDELADAVACFAEMDLYTARSEMTSIFFGIVIDTLNLVTQVLFAFTKSDNAKSHLEVVESLPVAFWLTTAATILHLLFYCWELQVTRGEMADLKKDMRRQHDFESSETNEDMNDYAKTTGDSARGVKVKKNENLTDTGLVALAENCPRLQNVELTGCPKLVDPNEGWLPLVTNCSNLLHISLSDNKQVEDSWITPLPKYCPLLQKVCLKDCERITDASVQALTILQNLKHLIVAQCPNLTDDAFIGERGKIQALHSLAIDGLKKLTSEGIRKLLKRCGRNLENAYLDGLAQLQDTTMVDVAQSCHALKTIGMKGCVGIGDTAVHKLCECCRDLEVLGVSYCPKVTVASVQAVRRLEHLRTLFMEKKDDENLSKESLQAWELQLAQLVKRRGPQGTNTLMKVRGPVGKLNLVKMAQKQARVRQAFRNAAMNTLQRQGSSSIDGGSAKEVQNNPLAVETTRLAKTPSGRISHRFHLISGLQHGVDRGATLGIDRARVRASRASPRKVKAGGVIGGVSTGGYMPLGFKCDDYIQDSVIDLSDAAKESVRKEREWVDDPMCEAVRGYIERFGMREMPSSAHKVSFKDKDLGNVYDADILIAFRADVPNSGAGTEQTLNYALFGEYVFVEQFRHGKKAGGALLRDDLITNPGDGVQWREEQCRQRTPLPGSGDDARCPHLKFHRGKEYCTWKTFTHSTPKDEAKSAEKGRDCFKMQPVTAVQLQGSGDKRGREWIMQKARRSAVSFVLKQFDSGSRGAVEHYDAELVHHMVEFVQGVEQDWADRGNKTTLKILVTGPTEKVQPGVEERAASIFEKAFGRLLDAPRPERSNPLGLAAGTLQALARAQDAESRAFKRETETV